MLPFASAVLFAAILLSATNAQVRRCSESLVTWSGYIYAIEFREGKLDMKRSLVNYDRIYQEYKIVDLDQYGNGTMKIMLERYFTRTRYTYENGNCTKEKIDENAEFPTFGVPKGATRVGEPEYLGSKLPNLGVLVEQYTGTDGNKDYFYVMAPTSISDGRQCVPVMTSELTVSPLTERLVEFTNITTDLSDDPFAIPPGCSP